MRSVEREIAVELWDAFSTRIFGGNVAGVVRADEEIRMGGGK
jgi:predicted PhzF superfamily epimerase YddE/YHI9